MSRPGIRYSVGDDSDHWIIRPIIEGLADTQGAEGGKLDTAIPLGLEQVVRKISPKIAADLLKRGPQMLGEREALRRGFEARLYDVWGDALDLLKQAIVVSEESGERLLNRHRKSRRAPDLLLSTLLRLHARGCRTAAEIAYLLDGGFAPGAMARWRTLHEVVVTAAFLVQYAPDAVQQYVDHEHVDSYKRALAYQAHCGVLGYSPLRATDVKKLHDRRDKVVAQYGKEFDGDYGWATKSIGRRATFAEIEKSTRLEFWRPYYKLSCIDIHGGVKSLLFSLSLPDGPDVLLTGSTNVGLADPGMTTARSLFHLTALLLGVSPTVTNAMALQALGMMVEKAETEFIKAHRKLARRIAAENRRARRKDKRKGARMGATASGRNSR